ncbi:hypothetical protein Val02_70550 [Virgisporangium aliadipatigenens]|uniref:Transcription factor zinc-finger domain-containing protein n=1 Tax=Virgisporangium aliadipatigenens TaxID=741659 RepID=A0A8J4DTW4_9ACTN|nr:zf-TFIIB domain-containing protein [Virgisporangium aliadipatigenens]GIJ50169.1 hypothetical protein Val02_70550 [Virgisporangium aliadipatigenens]
MRQLTCPKCKGAMRVVDKAGVAIDECVECKGIFLDRGEMQKLFEAEREWQARQVPPSPPGVMVPATPPPLPEPLGGPPAPQGPPGGFRPGPGSGDVPFPPAPPPAPMRGDAPYVPPPPPPPPPAPGGPAPYGPGYPASGHGYPGTPHRRRHKGFLEELFD